MSARAGGRGRGDDIGPRLKRLILSSKPPTAVSLWNALNATEREAAVRAHVGADHQGRRQLESIVAEARHLRPATVRKWTVEKIVAAMKVVSLRDPGLALGLIQSHHIPGQLPMVKGFLSALGVAHDEGIVGSIDDVDASEEVVRSASGAIADEYGDRAAAVYLLALLHWRAPAGKKARAWLRELCETLTETPGPEADASHAPEPETADSSEEEIEGAQDDPSRQRSFTTLDRLLILAAVDTAQGIEGSLSKDELEDAVDELVKLNGRRHQSYFHAGFRDVLLDRPVAEELPAENQSRLRWYWTGAIQGWARRKRWDCIVREYANNPVVRELGSGSNTASEAAVRHVVEALRRQGQTVEIARYVKVGALVKEPRLFAMLLDAASELLRKGDAATARPIFELLLKARSKLEERGVSPAQ